MKISIDTVFKDRFMGADVPTYVIEFAARIGAFIVDALHKSGVQDVIEVARFRFICHQPDGNIAFSVEVVLFILGEKVEVKREAFLIPKNTRNYMRASTHCVEEMLNAIRVSLTNVIDSEEFSLREIRKELKGLLPSS